MTEEQNEIYLEFASEHFAQALSTLKQNGKLLKIKLANKQMPCLSFIIEQVINNSSNFALLLFISYILGN